MSLRPSTAASPLACSGLMYAGVPTAVSGSPPLSSAEARSRAARVMARPTPKSATTACPASSKMFSGLMSRCTIPWACACLRSVARYTIDVPPRPSSSSRSMPRPARPAPRRDGGADTAGSVALLSGALPDDRVRTGPGRLTVPHRRARWRGAMSTRERDRPRWCLPGRRRDQGARAVFWEDEKRCAFRVPGHSVELEGQKHQGPLAFNAEHHGIARLERAQPRPKIGDAPDGRAIYGMDDVSGEESRLHAARVHRPGDDQDAGGDPETEIGRASCRESV